MKILLTNDDGIASPGLIALEKRLSQKHEVWIVAPEHERSGTSHSITLREPIKITQIAEKRFTCGGTPADCVLYPLLGALPVKPDIVLSGINLGPNLGTDIIYSGTAAAARQAALMEIPGCALSLAAYTAPYHFTQALNFVDNNLEIIQSHWTDDHFLNINFPNTTSNSASAVLTHLSRRIYQDKLAHFKGPGKDFYYFLQGELPEAHHENGSDWNAVTEGKISICPVYLHPVHHTCEDNYRKTFLE